MTKSPNNSKLNRVGVDIGGTFTDVVLETASGRFSTKVLTTYTAPENAIIDGIRQVAGKAKIALSAINQIIHGTTLATNALIERRGAKTALVTTEGFRDVIEMRSESRFEQYDLNLTLPEPLLPRNRRYTVAERMDAKGNILRPLDKANIVRLAEKLGQANYTSIAIGLLHSYINDAHETMIRDVFTAHLPDVSLSLSSQVSPQMREYERFNTTIANAYIKPLIKSYLDRLKTRLEDESVTCPVFLMHSGGGIISIESAAEFPVRLVESGPAGGAVFAADIAAHHSLDKVLSFDMGGTTAKICLIKNQTPKTARVFEVARTYRFKKGSGMPISIPVIDMVEIGAGGGSLAHVDGLNQIRVGPESAGSEPGPACYGRGGARPAVTDADLMLGKLDPDNFAGGAFALTPDASASALTMHIGTKLEMDAVEAAWGLAEVVDENMANAARVHAVENGEDLSEYTMIAFGGAAPLHAGRLSEKLGINRCLIPMGAGVGSAIGFLRAPFSFEANRSIFMTITQFDSKIVADLFDEMEKEATQFVRSCDTGAVIKTEYKTYMRYAGQGWEIPVYLTPTEARNANADIFKKHFEEEYQKLFGRAVANMEIEITVWSVNAYTPMPPSEQQREQLAEQIAPTTAVTASPISGDSGKRQLFDPAIGGWVEAGVYKRRHLPDGAQINGSAIITEDETTIIIPSSRMAVRRADGCIDINIK